jgi:hypothetical protein
MPIEELLKLEKTSSLNDANGRSFKYLELGISDLHRKVRYSKSTNITDQPPMLTQPWYFTFGSTSPSCRNI